MSEGAKEVLALVMTISIGGSAWAWITDGSPWWSRAGFPTVAICALGSLLWSFAREVKFPDLLRKACGCYLERDGFCFQIMPAVSEGQFRLDVHFQSRFEGHCRAQVVFRPSPLFCMNRRPIDSLTVEIECEGGAYGVARVPWGVPALLQGTKQVFDVGAHAQFPSGRGAMIRVREGMSGGTAKRDGWSGVSTLSEAVGGVVVFERPIKYKLTLPTGVAETLPENSRIRIETLWHPSLPKERGQYRRTNGADPDSLPGVSDQQPSPG
jgi:hypothetical protein